MILRWPWLVAAFLLGFLVLLTLLVAGMQRHLAGETLLRIAAKQAGMRDDATVAAAPIHWTSEGVHGKSLRVEGVRGSTATRLEANDVKASIDWQQLLSGTWSVQEISVGSLAATFKDAGESLAAISTQSPAPASTPWLLALLPTQLDLGPMHVQRASLEFGRVSITDTRLTVERAEDCWTISGTGGSFAAAPWQPLEIDSFGGTYANKQFILNESILRTRHGGRVEMSGRWPEGIDLKGSAIPLEALVDSTWQHSVSGIVSGTATITNSGATGSVAISNGIVKASGLVAELATLAGLRDLMKIPVTYATGDFQFQHGSWEWKNIVVESEGLLRVEGTVAISKDRRLNGTLRLGLADSALARLPGARELVFKEPGNGYAWTPVKLGGTLDKPTEDLSPRLAVAAGGALLESVVPAMNNVPDKTRESVNEAINTLFNILGR